MESLGPSRRHNQKKWGTENRAMYPSPLSELSPNAADGNSTTMGSVTVSSEWIHLGTGSSSMTAATGLGHFLVCTASISVAIRVVYLFTSGKLFGHDNVTWFWKNWQHLKQPEFSCRSICSPSVSCRSHIWSCCQQQTCPPLHLLNDSVVAVGVLMHKLLPCPSGWHHEDASHQVRRPFQSQAPKKDGKTSRRTMKWRQFPVTPAYAFTDYRSKGQTIPHVIVNITNLPTGGLSLFNLYIALSRSSGRSTVRLLWDFDAKVFLAAHSAKLITKDDRLRVLDTETKKKWDLMRRGPTGANDIDARCVSKWGKWLKTNQQPTPNDNSGEWWSSFAVLVSNF